MGYYEDGVGDFGGGVGGQGAKEEEGAGVRSDGVGARVVVLDMPKYSEIYEHFQTEEVREKSREIREEKGEVERRGTRK